MNLPSAESKSRQKVVLLGTGGTIAGTAGSALDATGYRAAERGIGELLAALPAAGRVEVETEQVAQIDSKDLSIPVWQALVLAVARQLARPEVGGIVVTHGTDTLEETAYLLQRVLAPAKPVVLTAAMRPATSLQADGPQNLLDAIAVAGGSNGNGGVVAVIAGRIWSGLELRKIHTLDLDAFDGGDAGPLGAVQDGRTVWWRAWPGGTALGLAVVEPAAPAWPRVEIITSHAGSDGAIVDALLAQPRPPAGMVVAATGNATLHATLEAALWRAQAAGVRVWRCSRTGVGPVIVHDQRIPAVSLTPWQARVELLLQLLEATP